MTAAGRAARRWFALPLCAGTALATFGIPSFDAKGDTRRFTAEDRLPIARGPDLLAEPITLPDCPGLVIREWRSSPYALQQTTPSDAARRTLNELCKLANERYPVFIEQTYGGDRPSFAIDVQAFIMPANSDKDGKLFRNLNDGVFRFKSLFSDCCYWGFYAYKINLLFLRNDVLAMDKATGELKPNKFFRRTFLHEYAHVQNKQSGVLLTGVGKRRNRRSSTTRRSWPSARGPATIAGT